MRFGLRDGHVDRRPGESAGRHGRAHCVLEVAVDIRVQHLLILLGVISVGDDHVVAANYECHEPSVTRGGPRNGSRYRRGGQCWSVLTGMLSLLMS